VYTNKSHNFLGLCKPCLLQDRQGKRKQYDLNVKAKVNDEIINLVIENDSSKKKCVSLQKSNESLTVSLDLFQTKPRLASTVELDLRRARDEACQSQKEVERLTKVAEKLESLCHYRHNLYRKPSLFSNIFYNGPGYGLFCRILIKRGHRFVYFVGDRDIRPSGNLRDFYSERDMKYLLHLDNNTLLNCSKTSLNGICLASMINCVKDLSLDGVPAIANARILPASNGEINVVAICDIDPGTEIFVATYGAAHVIDPSKP
jgi:hypothetical protein